MRVTSPWKGSTEWMEGAACKGFPRAVFFPGAADVVPPSAKEKCDSCDVKAECLDFALRNPSLLGVWGGTSEEDRRKIRRQRRRPVKKADDFRQVTADMLTDLTLGGSVPRVAAHHHHD
jgi:WhiB family transcriptional regulator, redox-sensing transcriptional regulator